MIAGARRIPPTPRASAAGAAHRPGEVFIYTAGFWEKGNPSKSYH